MPSLADGLPAEIAAQAHPAWRRNEEAYWDARPALLAVYDGRWVAFDDGAVIVSSTSPVAVFEAAHGSGRHPFVIRVGAEGEACRMRQAAFLVEVPRSRRSGEVWR